MATVEALLKWGTETLIAHDNARLEAQVLLAFVLGCDRTALYTWPEKEVPEEQTKAFEALIARRQQNEPIAYLVGNKEFWSLSFEVTTDTLIPRQDTELIVQVALDHLPQDHQEVLDLGTGCGTIGCTLAHQRPKWQVYGTDVSVKALDVAKRNAKTLNIHNIEFIACSWLEGLQNRRFDAIVSNPPYIRAGDVHLFHGDLPYEPELALTPGPSGFEAFRIIIGQSQTCLKPQGLLIFEHGFDQAAGLQALLEEAGFRHVETFTDYAGNQRVTMGTFYPIAL